MYITFLFCNKQQKKKAKGVHLALLIGSRKPEKNKTGYY
jgi:hypothetical protein